MGRYRVISKSDRSTVTIDILAAGMRRKGNKEDINEIAKKLLNAVLLDLRKHKT